MVDKKCWCGIAQGKWALFVYMFLIVFPIQIILAIQFNSINPMKDFTPISPNCTITETIYEGLYQKRCSKRKYGCKDKYSYTFAAPQLATIDSYFYAGRDDDGYQFKSVLEEKSRGTSDCDDGGEGVIKALLFTGEESTTCY